MLTKYLIATVDVQSGESESSLWRRLQGSITRNCADTPLYRFTIPRLRSGTLDSLVKLSDTLSTSSILIEGVVDKIRQQIQDLERDAGAESGAPTVDGVPVETYLSRFVWDEEKYPIKPHPKEIAASIVSRVRKIEDSLKVQAADYSSVNNQIKSIIKKQNISLLQTRDFSSLVKPEDIITSEHLATILVIVPKYSQKEWLSCYEFLDTFVVPRSSKWIYEDNEHALYTVTLFAKVIDNFKVRVREKGFVAPNFTYNPEAQESKKYELEKLLQDKNALRTSLLQFLYASYSEVFSSWMHFTAVFLFVESTLRYGLLIPFLCVVLAPSTKSEKKVSSILGDLCGYANRKYWEESEDGAIHPYVFATIKVS